MQECGYVVNSLCFIAWKMYYVDAEGRSTLNMVDDVKIEIMRLRRRNTRKGGVKAGIDV